MGKGDLVLGSPRANASASELPRFYPRGTQTTRAAVGLPRTKVHMQGAGGKRRVRDEHDIRPGRHSPLHSVLLPHRTTRRTHFSAEVIGTGTGGVGCCTSAHIHPLPAHLSRHHPPRERTQRKHERLASLTRAYRRLVPRYRTPRPPTPPRPTTPTSTAPRQAPSLDCHLERVLPLRPPLPLPCINPRSATPPCVRTRAVPLTAFARPPLPPPASPPRTTPTPAPAAGLNVAAAGTEIVRTSRMYPPPYTHGSPRPRHAHGGR
ncbi:hypothetical protein B0H11DRAFT_2256883 [Mycena galericulata]|nr:hypothetical protein B0H11DRAFT_2256883 [Mycena galericulata]